jgi:predicted tellurium resistance membrane protein TerC
VLHGTGGSEHVLDQLLLGLSFAGEGVGSPGGGLFSVAGAISLVTLASLEIVLGIDNIIFIAILSGRLPREQQPKARQLGIAAAVVTRVLLLLSLSWVMGLTHPLMTVAGIAISGKQLILIAGWLFLIGKSTFEIHDKLEGAGHGQAARTAGSLAAVIVQIMLVDMVFSLDSVITAVGMTPHVPIMIVAVLVAAAIMMVFAGPVSDFVHKHPTIKILALSFLILIGVMLVAEGFGQHVNKGYIYFAMAFSLMVELLNMRLRGPAAPVELRHSQLPG